jgi:hypothetical protein
MLAMKPKEFEKTGSSSALADKKSGEASRSAPLSLKTIGMLFMLVIRQTTIPICPGYMLLGGAAVSSHSISKPEWPTGTDILTLEELVFPKRLIESFVESHA